MSEETSKQKAIREAYGEYWEDFESSVDVNGWINGHFCDCRDYNLDIDLDDVNYTWRLKSLQGIETNKGWIKIESESDLPKDSYGQYHVYSENRMYCDEPKNQGIEPFWQNDRSKTQEWMDNFSHYQPIIKPQPPIY